MAQDIYKLLTEPTGIEGPVVLAGHDIELMMATEHTIPVSAR